MIPPDAPQDQAVFNAEGAAAAADSDPLTLPVGTQVAEFVITGLIGVGGFGIVYRAHDETLGRVVALKEYMPATLALRQEGNTVSARSTRCADLFLAGRKGFVNEARMLALFDHPALVKVYRFWEANGTAYMEMPLYEGQTLKQTLAAMSAPPSEAWLRQLLLPLLESLEIIHAKNCFHRDIAPDNIFLLQNGQPVLLDFGAARQVIGGMANNLTVILKPGYAPIEQYSSDPNLPQGPWTDIYALGAVLYQAITGHTPHTAVSRLVTDDYEPLAHHHGQAYSRTFLAAIDKALRVRPVDRPQSVAEFRALMALPADLPSPNLASPPAAGSPLGQRLGGPYRLPLLGGAAALLLVMGAAGYWMTGPSPHQAAQAPLPVASATADEVIEPTIPAANSTAVMPAASAHAKASATPLATSAPDKRRTASTPQWLLDMRQKLAACDAQNMLGRVLCIDRVRRTYCNPAHWGKVPECRVSSGPTHD